MAAIGTGSGKLILFGEHAAVFGYPAIGVSLPERTVATIDGPRMKEWNLSCIPLGDQPVLMRLINRLEDLVPELAACGPRTISIESTVPQGVGMGSSAALCSAVTGAALKLIEEMEPTDHGVVRTWQLAHELERLFHGTPSGVDTGLSLLSGVTAFSPKPPMLPDWEHLRCEPLWIVVGALPRSRAAGALIQTIGERVALGDHDVRDNLVVLGTIAAEAKRNLCAGARPDSIGRLAGRAMDALRALGLSDPSLDALLLEGQRAGALGGKLSGAGGGGAFFLVCAGEQEAGEIAATLERLTGRGGIKLAARLRALCVG